MYVPLTSNFKLHHAYSITDTHVYSHTHTHTYAYLLLKTPPVKPAVSYKDLSDVAMYWSKEPFERGREKGLSLVSVIIALGLVD